MQVTIHTAFITDGKHAFEIVSASHDDLIARVGDYCRQHWSEVSSEPPPENLKVLVDAYFASADASLEFTRERPDLPEPYASAPRLLACLESLLAAQSAYKPGDGEAFAALCGETVDARAVVAKASATLIRALPNFTVFCQEAGGKGTIHIDRIGAADLESAIIAGKQQCIDDWSYGTTEGERPWNLESVHCLGVASGDVEILYWQDQPE
jgi:hypothetical protein